MVVWTTPQTGSLKTERQDDKQRRGAEIDFRAPSHYPYFGTIRKMIAAG